MYIPRSCVALLLLYLLLCAACGSSDSSLRFESVRTLGRSNQQFGEPFGIAVQNGEIFISDGQVGKVSALDQPVEAAPISGDLDTPSAIAFAPDGRLLAVDSARHAIFSVGIATTLIAGADREAGFSDGPVSQAKFNGPVGIAVDTSGKVFVADTYNDRIRVIENGVVSTIAGSAQGFADGIGASAQFDTPLGLAIWGERLLVADAGNRRIRVVEPDGRVWTLAGNGGGDLVDGFPLQASFVRPTAIAVSPDGAIYIADGNAIRVIGRRSFAFVETIAGGTGRGFRDGNPLTAQFNRPSGLAFDGKGRLLVADSDNGLVRIFDFEEPPAKTEVPRQKTYSADEFRSLQPPRWPYDPPEAKRDIAGTLGEIRGEIGDENSQAWFHNGLDIAGGYGETARFIRDEKVLNPMSADNFGTLRELLRMPTIGYIHIRLGRDKDDRSFNDPRFLFSRDPAGELNDVRVPRGASFKAGEPIGTLNAMNHVHMVAGKSGAEMNALAALVLPNVSDSIEPMIQDVSAYDPGWNKIETESSTSRIKLTGKTRIVVRAFDRMDGNPERRRLGVYRVGYQLLNADSQPATDVDWTITFDRNPPSEAVKTVYAPGSKSGATGETIFNYIVTNRL
ncbi:MAG TPA: hypothetical protein VFZ49_00965, partial [Pyrinomonadaceae bacterium]